MFLVGGILAGAVGVQLRRQFEASIGAATARDRVTNLFGQHVSPEVVEQLLLEGGDASSNIRRVAVMFVDFRSFTAGARERAPQEVVDRLDGAFAILVDILDRHGGIVNKFLGDGFLALFGAPIETADVKRQVRMIRNSESSSWCRDGRIKWGDLNPIRNDSEPRRIKPCSIPAKSQNSLRYTHRPRAQRSGNAIQSQVPALVALGEWAEAHLATRV